MSEETSSPGSVPKFMFLVAVGIAITVATGAVYGHLSQRWGPAPDLSAAAQHLKNFPTQFGDWQLLKEEPIDEPTLRILSCAGYVNRQYVNRQSGETVLLAVVLGPAGPISVHTPEICYSSRAYSITTPRKSVLISDRHEQANSFWSLTFRSNAASADQLRVYYGWYADRIWTAAVSPRFEFAGRPLLYKLQLASLVSPTDANNKSDSQDPCRKFLTDLLQTGWSSSG